MGRAKLIGHFRSAIQDRYDVETNMENVSLAVLKVQVRLIYKRVLCYNRYSGFIGCFGERGRTIPEAPKWQDETVLPVLDCVRSLKEK